MSRKADNGVVRVVKKATNKKNLKVTIPLVIILLSVIVLAAFFVGRDSDKGEIRSSNDVVRYYQEKLPSLEKAVKEDSNDFAARMDYAIALYATGDLNEAKKQYEVAISIKGDDVVLRNNLGNVLRDKGDYDGAIKEYKQAIKIDPRNQNAYINLASLQTYTLNKTQDGIETYKKAIKAMPDNMQIELQLGLAYEQAGNNDEAVKTFRSVLAKNPDNSAAKTNLTRLGAL